MIPHLTVQCSYHSVVKPDSVPFSLPFSTRFTATSSSGFHITPNIFCTVCYYYSLEPEVCCNRCSYEPGPSFEEAQEEPVIDISPTGSEEFWLLQWPKDKLSVSDFHGKEISLKLRNDGSLGTLESSGKSYDLVSFASQRPDAIVFLPSESETKAVGKISRRVSLVRYPGPEELEKQSFASLTPSIKKSAGSSRKTMSRFTGMSKNRSSQGSALSLGARSILQTPKHKRKEEHSSGHSNAPSKASQGSNTHGAQSNAALELQHTTPEKSKKKKVRIAE